MQTQSSNNLHFNRTYIFFLSRFLSHYYVSNKTTCGQICKMSYTAYCNTYCNMGQPYCNIFFAVRSKQNLAKTGRLHMCWGLYRQRHYSCYPVMPTSTCIPLLRIILSLLSSSLPPITVNPLPDDKILVLSK